MTHPQLRYEPGRTYPPAGDWLTISEMTRRLSVGKDWMRLRLKTIPHQPEWRQSPGHTRASHHYSPECFAKLRRQAQTHLRHPNIGQGLSILEAAEELGCTDQWLFSAIKRLKLEPPKVRRKPNNRLALSITREAFQRLRNYQVPLPQQDWRNVTQLMHETGWSHRTIIARLKRRGYKPSRRRSSVCGRPALYFPPEVVPILGVKPRHIPPGGDWMTAERMAGLLERHNRWLKSRLTHPCIFAASQLRLDDFNSIRRHYPPWVFRKMKAESDSSVRLTSRQRAS